MTKRGSPKSDKKNPATDKLRQYIFVEMRGRSINQFAAEAGISQSYMSEFLNGKKIPSVKSVQKLSRVLNISATQMFFMLGWLKEPDIDTVFMDTIAGDSNLRQLVTIYLDLPVRDRKAITHIARSLKELDIK